MKDPEDYKDQCATKLEVFVDNVLETIGGLLDIRDALLDGDDIIIKRREEADYYRGLLSEDAADSIGYSVRSESDREVYDAVQDLYLCAEKLKEELEKKEEECEKLQAVIDDKEEEVQALEKSLEEMADANAAALEEAEERYQRLYEAIEKLHGEQAAGSIDAASRIV